MHHRKKGKKKATAARDTKRKSLLERNRMAASKSRQKNREWMDNLEKKCITLGSRNSDLQAECDTLMGEISRMKTQVMGHARCNDPKIDEWIKNEARMFLQSKLQA